MTNIEIVKDYILKFTNQISITHFEESLKILRYIVHFEPIKWIGSKPRLKYTFELEEGAYLVIFIDPKENNG